MNIFCIFYVEISLKELNLIKSGLLVNIILINKVLKVAKILDVVINVYLFKSLLIEG